MRHNGVRVNRSWRDRCEVRRLAPAGAAARRLISREDRARAHRAVRQPTGRSHAAAAPFARARRVAPVSICRQPSASSVAPARLPASRNSCGARGGRHDTSRSPFESSSPANWSVASSTCAKKPRRFPRRPIALFSPFLCHLSRLSSSEATSGRCRVREGEGCALVVRAIGLRLTVSRNAISRDNGHCARPVRGSCPGRDSGPGNNKAAFTLGRLRSSVFRHRGCGRKITANTLAP